MKEHFVQLKTMTTDIQVATTQLESLIRTVPEQEKDTVERAMKELTDEAKKLDEDAEDYISDALEDITKEERFTLKVEFRQLERAPQSLTELQALAQQAVAVGEVKGKAFLQVGPTADAADSRRTTPQEIRSPLQLKFAQFAYGKLMLDMENFAAVGYFDGARLEFMPQTLDPSIPLFPPQHLATLHEPDLLNNQHLLLIFVVPAKKAGGSAPGDPRAVIQEIKERGETQSAAWHGKERTALEGLLQHGRTIAPALQQDREFTDAMALLETWVKSFDDAAALDQMQEKTNEEGVKALQTIYDRVAQALYPRGRT